MHPSPLFRWEDRTAIAAFARATGFGTLFLQTPERPRVAHLPFVMEADALEACGHQSLADAMRNPPR